MSTIVKVDGLGERIVLPRPAQRIVSLVPSQTELLDHLGLDEGVVGVTRYCVHPPHWTQTKAVVGGTKKVRLEKVSALEPDLILANKEENTRSDVEALRALAPVFVTDVRDLESATAMVRCVGALTGRSEDADTCADEIGRRFAELEHLTAIKAAYLIWQKPLMSVGSDTFIHDMMARAGFDNVFSHLQRYPELKPDDLVRADPEVEPSRLSATDPPAPCAPLSQVHKTRGDFVRSANTLHLMGSPVGAVGAAHVSAACAL